MTADVELLPLPSWAHKADKLLCDTDWLRTQVSNYARACVAHATAAKDAEIEALRAEVELLRMGVCGDACLHIAIERDQLKSRTERLAEALRGHVTELRGLAHHIAIFDEATARRARTLADSFDAALEQENDDA